MAMKNTIRCCISCILPCGALDVIRIVHCNGRVEEITGTVRASEIMKAYPKHVLKKPSSSSSEDGVVSKIVIVPPDAELQRGKIYFLMPMPPSTPPEKKPKTTAHHRSKSSSTSRRKRKENYNNNTNSHEGNNNNMNSNNNNSSNSISMTTNLVISDRYLSEILSEKISTHKDRRRGRVGVWRPHLESISETSNDS